MEGLGGVKGKEWARSARALSHLKPSPPNQMDVIWSIGNQVTRETMSNPIHKTFLYFLALLWSIANSFLCAKYHVIFCLTCATIGVPVHHALAKVAAVIIKDSSLN